MSSPNLHEALQHHFAFPTFRPGQEEAINHVLAGQDTLVVMPTGAGKSLCYQLSSLLLPGTTLVISPLIALMKDQVDALTEGRIAATYVNSSLPASEQRARLRAMAEGAYKLVYVAPERLRSVPFRQALAQVEVSLLAVDEAHCISQWGHDFRPDYLHLRQAITDLGRPTVLASTATATRQVQIDIIEQLGLDNAQWVVTGFNRPNLALIVRYTPDPTAKLRELRELLAETDGSAIIYTGTRREAEEVADFVNEVVKKRAAYYHAGLEPNARTHIQEAFMGDQVPIVVATNAFGMGVDKPDVRAVVHFNVPGTVEAYYQEAGRAGRDGQPAQCVLLYSPEDRALQEWFIDNDAPSLNELLRLYNTIRRAAGRGIAWLASEDLQRATGLHQVKVRVGISQLEQVGALSQLGDQMGQMGLELLPVEELSLKETAAEVEVRREHKRRLLEQMVTYAETDACRRRYILGYFGDPGDPEAERCCDNCLTKAETPGEYRKAESREEWIPIVILETIRTLRWGIGRKKLAQLLKGSKAKGMAQFEYDKHRFYGKLPEYTLKQLQDLVDQLVRQRYLKMVGGEYPVLQLTPQGQAALDARQAIDLKVAWTPKVTKQQARKGVSDTVGETHQLFQEGLTPEEIADKRGLTVRTIYNHLSQLIGRGLVGVDALVATDTQQLIRAAIADVGMEYLSPIKQHLPDSVSYEEIRCVVEDEKRKQREGELATVTLPTEARRILGLASKDDKQAALDGLASQRTREAVEVLLALLRHETDGSIRGKIVCTLGEMGRIEAVPSLIKALSDESSNVRRLAASALGKLRARRAVQPLLRLLSDDKPQVRQYAIRALRLIGDPAAIPAIEKIQHDPKEKEYNRRAAAQAIKHLSTRGATAPQQPRKEEVGRIVPADTAQLILDCIRSFDGQLSRSTVAKILFGSHSKRISPYQGSRFYGKLSHLGRKQITEMIDQLATSGYVELIDGKYPKVRQRPEPSAAIQRPEPAPTQPSPALIQDEVDEVEQFLHRARPRLLKGPWHSGFALDFHSRFQGARWDRSDVGEMAYRFKYQGDRSLGRILAERLAQLMAEQPELREVDSIIPVPPSLKDRAYDPVDFLADLLARQTGLPVLKGKLIKIRQTRPQKEMANLAQKRANVAGAFRVRGDPSGLSPSGQSLRGKRLLVLDDLYDSGATLEEVTRVLLAAGARSVYVLTLTKTIHTD